MGAIQEALNKYGEDTVKIIQGNLSSTGTDASGETSRSVRSEGKDDRVTVSGKAFIFVVETGRKAGKRPPVSKILKWLQTGKVSVVGKIESAAFAISKVIGEKGSALFRKGGRTDIIQPALSNDRLDKLNAEIADIELFKTVKAIENGIAGNN